VKPNVERTTSPSVKPPPLYPIVNVAEPGTAAAARATALALALARAGLAWVQLRAKPLSAGEFTRLALALAQEFDPLGCRLIVNDRADVALAVRAAGLHLGDEDLPAAAARTLLGPAALIGYSTHSAAEVAAVCNVTDTPLRDVAADDSVNCDVDYLGFGPVFESPTKAGVRDARGLTLLTTVCANSRLPVVAIGGITLETAPQCWQAGAASVAIISELERAFEAGRLDDLLQRYRTAATRHGF